MTQNYIGVGFAVVLVLGVVLKVIVDRHMTVGEGIVTALLFASWGYMQLHGRPGNSGLLLLIGFILLARMYQRNAPVYRQRLKDQLEVIRARRSQRLD